MANTSFHALLLGGDADAVADLLRHWLQPGELKVRERIFGTEMSYDTEELSLFCEKDDPLPDSRGKFLIQGTVHADPAAAADRLRPLLALAAARDLDLTLEYAAVDEHGEQIGDEMSLT